MDGEHEDAEDDANGVKDEELWDQNSVWDLEFELGLVDNNQRQIVSWRHSDYFLIQFIDMPSISTNNSYTSDKQQNYSFQYPPAC